MNDPVNRVDPSGLQEVQVSGGGGATGFLFFGGAHIEANVGVSFNWNNLLDSKIFFNAQFSPMVGFGLAATAGGQLGGGGSEDMNPCEINTYNTLHIEGGLGYGGVAGASLDLPMDSNLELTGEGISAMKGKGGGGAAAYIGVGPSYNVSYTTPTIRSIVNWFSNLNLNWNSWRK